MTTNITIHSTIYTLYKICRGKPLEPLKSYPTLEQAKKVVGKTIFQLTDTFMTTRNVITDHSITKSGTDQYKILTIPKNDINPCHRLECFMYIQPYNCDSNVVYNNESIDSKEEEDADEDQLVINGQIATCPEDKLINPSLDKPIDQPSVDLHSSEGRIVRPSDEQPSVDKKLDMDEKQSSERIDLSSGQDELDSDSDSYSEEEVEVGVDPTTSLGHYLNGFGISSLRSCE